MFNMLNIQWHSPCKQKLFRTLSFSKSVKGSQDQTVWEPLPYTKTHTRMICTPSLYTFPPTPSSALSIWALLPITTLKLLLPRSPWPPQCLVDSLSSSGPVPLWHRRDHHSLLPETLPSLISRALPFPGSPAALWLLLCQFLLIPQTFKCWTAAGLSLQGLVVEPLLLRPLHQELYGFQHHLCPWLPKLYHSSPIPSPYLRLISPALYSASLPRGLQVVSNLKCQTELLIFPLQTCSSYSVFHLG